MRINDNGIDRDMTPEEQTAHETAVASAVAEQIAIDKIAAAKEATRAAALAKLGLTADEIAALFG